MFISDRIVECIASSREGKLPMVLKGTYLLALIAFGCGKTSFSGSSQVASSTQKAEDAEASQAEKAVDGVDEEIASSTAKDQESGAKKSDASVSELVVDSNPVEGGLAGGHFDLDTSIGIYAAGSGKTNSHTHAYDDTFNVLYADFLKLFGKGDIGIDQGVVDPSKRFVLTLVNADLSPGAIVSINGKLTGAQAFAKEQLAALGSGGKPKVYTIGAPTQPGDEQLKELRIYFGKDIIAQNGIVQKTPPPVWANQPGPNGEYRAGALTIQALDASNFKIDPKTGSAEVVDGGFLWEGMLFWHKLEDRAPPKPPVLQ